jgi:hypothetical protein
MGRMRPTGMYRNAFKHERSLQYERSYRAATAEFERDLKPKRAPYRRKTVWFEQMYPKAMPAPYLRKSGRR